MIVALLTPIVFCAWCTSQPMSMPEYGGRTYCELLAERCQDIDNLPHYTLHRHDRTEPPPEARGECSAYQTPQHHRWR